MKEFTLFDSLLEFHTGPKSPNICVLVFLIYNMATLQVNAQYNLNVFIIDFNRIIVNIQ